MLEKPETIKRRLKARFSQVPKDRSLADELIAERGVQKSIAAGVDVEAHLWEVAHCKNRNGDGSR